jgi:hypothetical protein
MKKQPKQSPTGNTGKPLPKVNVDFATSSDAGEMTVKKMRALMCNPIYAGIGQFPALVDDETWVCAAARMICLGLNPFGCPPTPIGSIRLRDCGVGCAKMPCTCIAMRSLGRPRWRMFTRFSTIFRRIARFSALCRSARRVVHCAAAR